MGRASGCLLALASVLLPVPTLAEDPPAPKAPPPLPKNDAAFKARVNRAIDRGVEWVLGEQRKDGGFGRTLDIPGRVGRDLPEGALEGIQDQALGESSLALYALRACGVPDDDPRIVRGFEWLRKQYLSLKAKKLLENYSVALTLLALEAHRNPPEDPGPETDRYGKSVRPKPDIPPPDLDWMKELTAWLVAAQTGDGGFGYHSPPLGWHDHSNMQYSLLALKAARRCGIPVPPRVWEKSAKHLLRVQERDGPAVPRRERSEGGSGEGDRYGPVTRTVAGVRDRARGWGYGDHDPATGSMTTGGVSSLVICRSELIAAGLDPGLDGKLKQAIWDGLAWLGLHFSVKENPGPAGAPMGREHWQYYYLYGLERAGVLAGVVLMGEHDWYFEGAAYLLDEQDGAGGWAQGLDGLLPPELGPRAGIVQFRLASLRETCWALLFLKRATVPVRRGGVATEAGAESLDLAGSADLGNAAFRDLFDAVFARFAAADEARRRERAADFVRMGLRSLPLLVLRLDSAEESERAAALDALRTTTGLTHGFDPAAPEEARASAVRAWEEWWFARKARLVADGASGRFRDAPP